MSKDISEEFDDILSDVLAEAESAEPNVADQEITLGQSIEKNKIIDTLHSLIDKYGSELDIPDSSIDIAKSLSEQYRNERGDFYGNALELLAASCLYCGGKVTEVPLQPNDFADIGGPVVSRKGLLRRSKDIASTVGLDPSAFFETTQYVDRFCEELNASDAVRDRANEILNTTDEEGLSSGKSPSGWAAAGVYNAALDVGEKYTQKEVSNVADATEVTIRNRYQEQRELLRNLEELPPDPSGVVEHVGDRTGVDSKIQKLAKLLIENARIEDHPVDENATLWGLAALRRSGQLTTESIDIKTLSQYTDNESSEISKRAKQLRSVITQLQLDQFRSQHNLDASS